MADSYSNRSSFSTRLGFFRHPYPFATSFFAALERLNGIEPRQGKSEATEE